MNEAFYEFQYNENRYIYTFESVSETKIVRKTVLLSLVNESPAVYNLALVDKAEDGSFSDLSVSNNQDMAKVLATVFQVISLFLDQKPDSTILIQGSTPARTRLYQMAIGKYLEELEQNFQILGLDGTEFEHFERGKRYTSFIVLKQTNN